MSPRDLIGRPDQHRSYGRWADALPPPTPRPSHKHERRHCRHHVRPTPDEHHRPADGETSYLHRSLSRRKPPTSVGGRLPTNVLLSPVEVILPCSAPEPLGYSLQEVVWWIASIARILWQSPRPAAPPALDLWRSNPDQAPCPLPYLTVGQAVVGAIGADKESAVG